MIKHLRKNFAVDRAGIEEAGEFEGEAAVLVAVTDDPENPEIVLTLRADHLNSHSGEVSFPGGKWEQGDESLIVTALRESSEEVALPPEKVEIINVRPVVYSLWGIKVTPYIGIIPRGLTLVANPDELDSVFHVPVEYFLQDRRTSTDVYFNQQKESWSPVYHYEGYKIWGLTARILVEFLNDAWDAGITRENSAPEKSRKPRPASFT